MCEIAFVLPAYKGRFLHKAISSILNQTVRDFRLVVVDDQSPENLKSIVDQFNDPRVTYIRNAENIGRKSIVCAWSEALKRVDAEWCILASDDDIYYPDYLEEMLRLVAKYPDCDVFHCREACIDKNDKWKSIFSARPEYESAIDMLYNRGILRAWQVMPNFMFRRSVLLGKGGFPDFPRAWFTDDATWLLMAEEHGCACSSKILFGWRMSGENISTGNRDSLDKVCATEHYRSWVRKFIDRQKPHSRQEEMMLDLVKDKMDGELDRHNRYLLSTATWADCVKGCSRLHYGLKSTLRVLIKKLIIQCG